MSAFIVEPATINRVISFLAADRNGGLQSAADRALRPLGHGVMVPHAAAALGQAITLRASDSDAAMGVWPFSGSAS